MDNGDLHKTGGFPDGYPQSILTIPNLNVN